MQKARRAVSEMRIMCMPVGVVRTSVDREKLRSRKAKSSIVFSEDLTSSLEGIEGFSHILVIFWMHGITAHERKTRKVHPRGREDIPLQGVFATRAPSRPNPIGLTLARLVRRKGNVLTVEGLDALDGTPVLDVKPFDPWDTAREARVPTWWKKLQLQNRSTNR